MGYADSLLAQGERIVLRERRHWLAVPIDSKWAILAIVVAIALAVINLDGTTNSEKGVIGSGLAILILILVVGGLAWIAWTVWNWLNEDYLVTNRRILRVEGVINKHATDSSLEKINDAALDQHFIGRIFGYGDLDILTANETSGDRFKMLAHVVAFKREMLNQKNELEFEGMRPAVSPPLRAGTSTSATTPPPPAPMPAPASQPPMSATGDLMTGTAGAVDSNGATVTMDPGAEAGAGRRGLDHVTGRRHRDAREPGGPA